MRKNLRAALPAFLGDAARRKIALPAAVGSMSQSNLSPEAGAPAPLGFSDWVERFRRGDRRALSRLLSLAARGERLPEIESVAGERPQGVLAVAITGSGGVGKSSLIGRLIEHLRSIQEPAAVLACDPQSSFTGGALLGDRIRMPPSPADDGVFIRSLATPAGQQSVAPQIGLMTRLLWRHGFRNVILETVGAGQGDIAVRDVADVVVVLVQPEAGDDLQWEKAGVLEIADIVVVHKFDLPGAGKIVSQMEELLHSGGGRLQAVVAASASRRIGIDELWKAIDALRPAAT